MGNVYISLTPCGIIALKHFERNLFVGVTLLVYPVKDFSRAGFTGHQAWSAAIFVISILFGFLGIKIHISHTFPLEQINLTYIALLDSG